MQWRSYHEGESYEVTALCPHCWGAVTWWSAVKFCALCGKQAEGLDESHRQRGQLKWTLRCKDDIPYKAPLPQPRWSIFQRYKAWDNAWTLMDAFGPQTESRAEALALARWVIRDDPDMDCALVWGTYDYKQSFDILPEGMFHIVKQRENHK